MYIRVVGKDITYFKDKEIILFGAGSCGLRALEEFKKIGAHIIAFCDNNRTLAGTTLNGYSIIAPEQIYCYPEANIIISSTFDEDIAKQLKDMKISKFFHIKLGVLRETKSKEDFSNVIINNEDMNQYIYDGLIGPKEFFIGRLGSVELECLCHYLYFLDRKTNKTENYPENVKMMMNINAGFFPCDEEQLDKFCELYLNDINSMDIIWSMWFSAFEDKLYKDHYSSKMIADYDNTVFPYNNPNPWTAALKGKKVLVIHPFETSIQKNYKIKDKLFDNKLFLPDFELLTYKPVQSIAGNKPDYDTWFDALEAMKQDISKIDFDIAFIAAGAYGLALGAHVKRIGKKAFHVGGILQLYFGIRGKAWDKYQIHNEYWTSPLDEEKPEGFKKVEAGRYW